MFVREESLHTGRSCNTTLWYCSLLQEPARPEADVLYYKLSSCHLNCCCCCCLCLDSHLRHSEFFKSESSKVTCFPPEHKLGNKLSFTSLSLLLQRNLCHCRGDCIKACVQLRIYVMGLTSAKCYLQGHCMELNFICMLC